MDFHHYIAGQIVSHRAEVDIFYWIQWRRVRFESSKPSSHILPEWINYRASHVLVRTSPCYIVIWGIADLRHCCLNRLVKGIFGLLQCDRHDLSLFSTSSMALESALSADMLILPCVPSYMNHGKMTVTEVMKQKRTTVLPSACSRTMIVNVLLAFHLLHILLLHIKYSAWHKACCCSDQSLL